MPRDAPLVVGLVSGSHVVNHAYLLLFAPAFSLLSADFGVSLAQLGLAVGLINAVVTVGQLPLGYISDSYSHAAVLVGSLAVGTLGCGLAALAPSYEWLLAAAAVMGLGVAGHHPAHYPLISAAAPDAYRSRAYSAHGFAGALGLALPFAVVPAAVALGFGWQAAFGAIAALGAVYTVITVLVVRRLPHSITRAGAEARDGEESVVDALRTVETTADRLRLLGARAAAYFRTIAGAPLILLLTALWFVNSAAIWGVRAYAATLLDVGYGLDSGTASLVASAMLVVGAVILLGGGYVADRIGPTPMLFVGYGSLVVFAAALSTALLPALAAVGVVLLLAATVDISRPARATLTDLASERRDVGKNFALMTIGISAGGAVAPPAFGYAIEVAGVYAAFTGVAATAGIALLLSVSVARAA
ncbi:MFS transporter [Natronomonas halophila]|uniref:MFS transporter n=1 Tax=Natronomonas halophila TaxID=2747817 RepID=UPI0015B3DB84|nr:MFS transporter [Natronomonas halophila]QLD85132.1 MFS transporter [Natronomonas halophila]